MQGYDLDDTLAAVDFRSGKPLPQMFADAPVIYRPAADFVVITGRPHATKAERQATLKWLAENQPRHHGIHYVDAHDAKAIAAAKGAIIERLRLSDYTDNNTAVLAALAKLATGAKLWTMGPGGTRTPYVDRAALARAWAPTHPLAR